MIDINIDNYKNKYNSNNNISDEDLIKAIKESKHTDQVSVIEYSSDAEQRKNIHTVNFDDMNERNTFLEYYFNSSVFD